MSTQVDRVEGDVPEQPHRDDDAERRHDDRDERDDLADPARARADAPERDGAGGRNGRGQITHRQPSSQLGGRRSSRNASRGRARRARARPPSAPRRPSASSSNAHREPGGRPRPRRSRTHLIRASSGDARLPARLLAGPASDTPPGTVPSGQPLRPLPPELGPARARLVRLARPISSLPRGGLGAVALLALSRPETTGHAS